MDVILDLVAPTPEVVAIDVVNPDPTIQLTVVSGSPGADGQGVVPGGTTGQVLVKASNTNFDTVWADPDVAAGVASVNGDTGVVVLTQDDIADGTTHKQYSSTEKTKLAGVATGATANDTDANLKARANHTGSQAISTVTGLQTAIDGKAAVSHTHAQSDVTGLSTALSGKSDTGHTHTASQVTDFATAVDARIQNVVAAAPAALDTLDELAAALGDDANFAGTVTTALAGKQPIDQDLTDVAALTPTNNDVLQRKAGAWTNRTPAQLKTDLALAKGDVGLGNVDNTADTAKPVSTAQQTALDLKAPLASPAFTGTPTGITKTHVGLGSVDNTADTAKPVSTAQQTALDARMVWADGSTSTNARPTTSSKVIWVGGTTQPVNMATGDLWVKA